MRPLTHLLLTCSLYLSSCNLCPGYDLHEFYEDMPHICDKMYECDMFTEYFTHDDCLSLGDVEDTGPQEEWSCEDYDCQAAKRCVRVLEDISCADFIADLGMEVCDQVCSNARFRGGYGGWEGCSH